MSQIRRPHLNVLNGVSCPTAANCMAVGYYDAAGNRQAFAEQWNGATWTTLVIPHNGALRAVSCPAVNSCKAVGSYLSPGRRHTLTATWDGTAWTVQPSPDLGGLITEFTGVSCTGGSNCIANCIVGGDDSARSGPLRPLNGALERYGVAGADHPHPRWRRRPDLDLRPRAAAPAAAPGHA